MTKHPSIFNSDDPASRCSQRIFLTTKGHKIASHRFRIVTDVNDWLMWDLNPMEKQAFAATLAKII